MWKKIVATFLVLIAVAVSVPMFASAESDEKMLTPKITRPRYAATVYSEENMAKYVNVDEFRSYLFSHFKECKSSIDISRFNLPSSNDMMYTICEFIWNQMPEAFHFYTASFSSYGRTFSSMSRIQYDDYADTASEFAACWKEFEHGAEMMLYGIEGNNALSAEQKALLLHDRLALWTEYDYDDYLTESLPSMSYNAYGVFAKRIAVCQGYAMAYDYLLERCGIRSDLCPSKQLDHVWNIVYIGGYAYHVDVTWDDPVWDVSGQVRHDNFLRSSNGMKQTGHDATDYDTSPYSTRYDTYYWQSSDAAVQLVGNDLYYLDKNTNTLNVLSNGTHRTVFSIANRWPAGSSSTWNGNFSRLSAIGSELLISTPKSVYAYNVNTGAKTTVYTPSVPASNQSIYGFAYENGKLVCEVSHTPVFGEYTKQNGRYTHTYYGTYVKPYSWTATAWFDKAEYYIGDTVRVNEMKMIVTYTDGSSRLIYDGYTYQGDTSAAGTRTVSATYGGVTGTFNITVKTPSITFDRKTLTADCDDAVYYPMVTVQPAGQVVTYSSNNTNAVRVRYDNFLVFDQSGTAQVTASFVYNGIRYTDTCTVTVDRDHHYANKVTPASTGKNGSVVRACKGCGHTISSKTIYAPVVSLSTTTYTYNGAVRTPSLTVKDKNGKALVKNTDYTVTYPSGRKNAGTYKIKIAYKGNYTGTQYVSFKINPISVSNCTLKLSTTSYTYNGAVKTPRVTVKNANGTTLTQNTHYTVSYPSGRKNAGTYTVTVKMKGNYGGSKTLSFKINPISMSKCTVKFSKTSVTYNGKTQLPSVVVKNANGTVLKNGTHYTLHRVTGCKNAGSHQMTVKMKGNYGGSKTFKFTIKPISISKCSVSLSNTSLIYTGKTLSAPVVVKNANGTKLSKNTHYTVSRLTGSVGVGEHKVRVTMKGNYSGSKTLTYWIFPQTTTITKLNVKGNKLTVYVAGRTAQVDGYQVEHSTSLSFKGAKTITVAGKQNTALPVTIPSAKRTYYVRVRTYKDVNGTRYCSYWETYSYVRN